jgi:glycine/D-amino acid oxidase-like deaminating enzyme/nitrite reductase/ring-hydroxylating ferredoxin subunit
MATASTQATRSPVWTDGVRLPKGRPLRVKQTADVCVVGAGIAGLSIAYHLARQGRSVVLLDDGDLAGGMTSVTSAHLSTAMDAGYAEIERLHGERGAAVAAASHGAAIDWIERTVREENLACEFERVDGYLCAATAEQAEELERDLAAAHRAGLTGVERLRRAPIDAFAAGPCLRFPGQAQFHPLKYLAGLSRSFMRSGGRVYTHSHVDSVEGGQHAGVTVGSVRVDAGAIVIATNSPINDRVAIHTKQAAYMTYVLGLRIPKRSVPRGLYWDTERPYHYVRTLTRRGAPDLLIVGGEDHKTGQADDTADRHERLEAWTRARFPMAEDVEYVWGGQVLEPVDRVAFIGRNPLDADNVYVVTGDAGMGLTHGTIAALLIADLIGGRDNDWAALYEPSRKSAGALGRFAKEAVNMAAQYADWVTPGDVADPALIAPDSGAVIRRGLKKVAVYRRESGELLERSAVCPHLGCIVQWNDAEKTWDCPCHGSRFAKTGTVINGPANSDLPPAD